MTESRQRLKYIISDLFSAMAAWSLFFFFRKVDLDTFPVNDVTLIYSDPNFWLGLFFVPVGWLLLYTMQGSYRRTLRKSRLKEFGDTLIASFIGIVVLFFAIMLDDSISNYRYYYLAFLVYLALHFLLTYLPRLAITTHTVRLVHQRRIGFPTLLIGDGSKAYLSFLDVENQEIYAGNKFVGYLTTSSSAADLDAVMPCLGTLADIQNVALQYNVEEAIVALQDPSHINQVLRLLSYTGDLIIKVTPDERDLILGSVRANNLFHSPFITIDNRLMAEWQYSIKRLADIFFSLVALIALSPLFLIIAIIIKATSPGPVFYAQERIGLHGRPFRMHKFRSMYVDAESNGPALSTDDDPRITSFGRFMRKVRLDEIPQFFNVLKGTMSLVGPRPERQFFIDQIVRRAPEYAMLHRIKPGITSWGQVKYGYASSVDEMLERLKYDLLYLENMSLSTDIKILLYTVLIIFQGRGK